MKKIIFISICLFLIGKTNVNAQDIKLPAPKTTGGMPLMEALSKRQTSSSFSARELDKQTLSNLLWAANGFNRADKRTAPTAANRQELELYVTLSSGLYLYDAKANNLIQKSKTDIRSLTGMQDFVSIAPVNILITADTEKQNRKDYRDMDTGYVSQNIYLFCASAGLSTVARAMFDAQALGKAMKLNDKQIVVLTQTVGYPE
jgi:SagB-type dehydrogenase family enzyme